jgi:hypothetical protein
MSLRFTKSLSRSIFAISAAALIHIGSAAAADTGDDIQSQVKELLTGSHAAYSPPRSEQPQSNSARSNVDNQEFARELLQGQTISVNGALEANDSDPPSTSGEGQYQDPPVGNVDFQESVRRLLRGEQ